MAAVLQPVGASFRNRTTWVTVAGVAAHATSAPVADEAALAQRAAAGDGEAFATLYESYEGRVYNLCVRILGSQDDAADAAQEAFVNVLRRLPKFEGRELAFGSYVFTSARNACYDLIERRRRTEPSDELPEHATPVGGGVGGGGMGYDPGDPEDDPERNVLLDARTEEIRHANLALPERQREARSQGAGGPLLRRGRRDHGHESQLGRPADLAGPHQPARRASRRGDGRDHSQLAPVRARDAADRITRGRRAAAGYGQR